MHCLGIHRSAIFIYRRAKITAETEKIYCYVDETGQDARSDYFIVSVVATKKDRNKLIKLLLKIETETNKKATKWLKTKREYQAAYIEKVFSCNEFKNSIFYLLTKETKAFKDTTIVTVASAINETKSKEKYKASVFIDGLERSSVRDVATGLRRVGLKIEKVRGVRDESYPLIRLADAMAGLIRKKHEKVELAEKLYNIGIKKGAIKRL